VQRIYRRHIGMREKKKKVAQQNRGGPRELGQCELSKGRKGKKKGTSHSRGGGGGKAYSERLNP